ncbi:ABC transporter ATP-binding protein [Desulfobulbus alkaliphilus]|uniref:ABC transporter ATP-binding protein n=1 Tax=Desulfobulbus alkaliphilus TaxID=869814 RepID=UPI0019656EC0|nr:ABC transporter ATP-binding protein [Desulfobulbus alkaliphilus]MBM9537600.1 ABC transporter ATP-binding protein [Desulfobulbus alkaliphilus]
MSLIIEQIRHSYGPNTVLNCIDLHVQPGEVVCLLGPSGCGKTSLLRLIAGLETLQHGRILINGRVVAEQQHQLAPEQRGIGFLFQDFALFPHLTVLENTLFGLGAIQDKTLRLQQATTALERVNMASFAHVYPHKLSGGQQQRVALARALAPKPGIILLDEPFSSLDARLRVQIRDQTLHVLKSSGVATVMVTHDPEEAMFMADRIVLMNRGRIVQTGSPVDLYSRPENAFVATFFSDVNSITGIVHESLVHTALGKIVAVDLPEGSNATIMFRPESILIDTGPTPPESAVSATVVTTRLLPGTTLVHLRLAPDPVNGEPLHLHARVPGVFTAPEGSRVFLRVPAHLFYIFVQEAERKSSPVD